MNSNCSSNSDTTDCKQQQQQHKTNVVTSNSDPSNLNDEVGNGRENENETETETESGTESGNGTETETETETLPLSQPLAQTNNKPAPLIDSDFSQVALADSTTSNCIPNPPSFISISIPTSISTSTSTSTSTSILASTFAIEPTITRLVQTTATHSDDAKLVGIAQRPVKETAPNAPTQSSLLPSYSPASNFSDGSNSHWTGIESTSHFQQQQSETQIQPSFLELGNQIRLEGRESLTSVRFPNNFKSVLQEGEEKQDSQTSSTIVEKMSNESAILR